MKTITIRCDGTGCSERVETTVRDPQTTDVYPPGWLKRRVVDELGSPKQGSRSEDFLLHYCPSCVRTVNPPLSPGLSSWWRTFRIGEGFSLRDPTDASDSTP